MKIIFTCEHGGNDIPEKYYDIFNYGFEDLNSHKGLDYGVLDFLTYCEDLSDYNISNSISRLLIELNRSLHHPKLFSKYSKVLSTDEKQNIINTYYLPYREMVRKKILEFVESGEEVVHFSFHSFTAVLKGEIRNTDIGILYDPSISSEKERVHLFKELLQEEDDNLKIRYNYPYLGKADGFTTSLRKEFPQLYSGIEIEVNQKFSFENRFPEELKATIYNTLKNFKKKISQ